MRSLTLATCFTGTFFGRTARPVVEEAVAAAVLEEEEIAEPPVVVAVAVALAVDLLADLGNRPTKLRLDIVEAVRAAPLATPAASDEEEVVASSFSP
jgi:hypothetical protein